MTASGLPPVLVCNLSSDSFVSLFEIHLCQLDCNQPNGALNQLSLKNVMTLAIFRETPRTPIKTYASNV